MERNSIATPRNTRTQRRLKSSRIDLCTGTSSSSSGCGPPLPPRVIPLDQLVLAELVGAAPLEGELPVDDEHPVPCHRCVKVEPAGAGLSPLGERPSSRTRLHLDGVSDAPCAHDRWSAPWVRPDMVFGKHTAHLAIIMRTIRSLLAQQTFPLFRSLLNHDNVNILKTYATT